MKQLGSALALTLLAASCQIEMAEKQGEKRIHTITREFAAANLTSINLEGTNGNVEVRGAATDRVTLTARVKTLRRRTAQDADAALKTELDDDTLYITEKRRPKRHVFLPFISSDDFGISYTLTVPQRMNLSLTNVNGSIDVAGVEGKSELRSVNGSIEVETPAGEVVAKTVNGRVRARFGREFRGARIKTVNGSITVGLPQNSSFDCDISQVNGSFKSNVPLAMSVNRGHDRDIDGEVNGGRYPLELTTVNGTVTVNQSSGAGT